MGDKSTKNNKAKTNWLFRNIIKVVIILAAVAVLTIVMKMPEKKREAPATEAPPVNVVVMTVTAEPQFADTFDLPSTPSRNVVGGA